MRVNKYISEAGLCSRREADELLLAGRVSINGEVVGTGAKALDGDEVRVDGEIVRARILAATPAAKKAIYIALNQPVGVTCTKIGRASCRDRVCQYVSIWVVAVSLKKKKKRHIEYN